MFVLSSLLLGFIVIFAIIYYFITVILPYCRKKQSEYWLNEVICNQEECLTEKGVMITEKLKGQNQSIGKQATNGQRYYLWLWEFIDVDPFKHKDQVNETAIQNWFKMDRKIGENRIYCKGFKGRSDIITWDIQRVSKEQTLKITFVQTNSSFRQGIRVAIDAGEGNIEVNGQIKKGIRLWENTAPKEIICKCTSQEGLISIYNLWDRGNGGRSLGYTSGMLVEKDGNKITYRCNDSGIDTNFEKLVFTVEKM